MGALFHPQVPATGRLTTPLCHAPPGRALRAWRRIRPLPCRMSHPTARSEPALAPAAARPEPHILLFRRPIGTDPTTGLVAGKRIDPNTGKVMP